MNDETDLDGWLTFRDGSLCAPMWSHQAPPRVDGENFVIDIQWTYKGAEDSDAAKYIRRRIEWLKQRNLGQGVKTT